MDKLLDNNRIVIIERVLREPEDLMTWEAVPYWLALALTSTTQNDNVKSLRIKEVDVYELPEGEKAFIPIKDLKINKWKSVENEVLENRKEVFKELSKL